MPANPIPPLVVNPPKTHPFTSVKDLVTNYDKCWNTETKNYKDIPFDEKKFVELIKSHNSQFKPIHNPERDFGFIQKKDLPNTKIFVRADLQYEKLNV